MASLSRSLVQASDAATPAFTTQAPPTSSPAVLEASRDGRVRNPTPSKLKGKTDTKQGKFGVMHMGTAATRKTDTTQNAAAERDAAARRTSENTVTASRAQAAQSSKYMPPRKRGLDVALHNEGGNARASPFGGRDAGQRARPLTPDETKYEQARLLTLLRSINPITVVDQICKAVAYFGGIPGAPPPEDGIFPESANTRETGALFIGWLSEIFPDLARAPDPPQVQEPPPKKGRGRPTAEKSAAPAPQKEPPTSANGFGYGPAVVATPTWGLPQSSLPQSTTLINTHPPMPAPQTGYSSSFQASAEGQAKSDSPAASKKLLPEGAETASTSKRGRGRPKGSTKKGKGTIDDSAAVDEGESQIPSNSEQQEYQVPQAPSGSGTAIQAAAANPSPLLPVQNAKTSVLPQQKVKPTLNNVTYQEQWQAAGSQNIAPLSALSPNDELSPEERAVLEAFRQPQPPHQSSGTASYKNSPAATTIAPPVGGVKRKRAPPKPKNAHVPAQTAAAQSNNQSTSNALFGAPNAQVQAGPNSTSAPMPPMSSPTAKRDNFQQWVPAATTPVTSAPPAAKRQRKPKTPGPAPLEPAPGKNTASVVSAATPPVPATLPESKASTLQQSAGSRTQVEGLEARVQHFANFQQQQQQQQQSKQQNGRSATPTISSQQQVRQHPKSNSISLQSGQGAARKDSPQLLQQLPPAPSAMQQTAHQNGRDDQKTTTSRSSSGFYSHNQQRSHALPYGQSYPAQSYGTHGASPQLSNAQTAQQYTQHTQPSPQLSASSYRTGSAHSVPQASPQYTQPDNTYRTASPHAAVAQTTPGFSQSDAYRTSTSLAQPTPSYSQGDNTYRTSAQHSLVQPSSTYTQAETYKTTPTTTYTANRSTQNQPAHQSHYNHFSDTSFIDLPTLESLGHSGGSGTTTNVAVGSGSYSQQNPNRSTGSSSSIYGTSPSLSSGFDLNSASDLLRRGGGGNTTNNGGYASSSGASGFDMGDNEMRERLMRNLQSGRR